MISYSGCVFFLTTLLETERKGRPSDSIKETSLVIWFGQSWTDQSKARSVCWARPNRLENYWENLVEGAKSPLGFSGKYD